MSRCSGRPAGPVIGVFQTLSAGKAGHFVPGKIVPVDKSSAGGEVVEVVGAGGT